VKYTIAIDFDGVLAQYEGWKGEEVLGEPVGGAREFVQKLLGEGYLVGIHSTRSFGKLVEWMAKYGFPSMEDGVSIYREKPRALVYIDDRAICFKGEFPSISEIRAFRPWWQELGKGGLQ
jgi:hypothetical protein